MNFRKKGAIAALLVVACAAWGTPATAAPIELYESRFNLGGQLSPSLPEVTFCCNLAGAPAMPAGWNVAGFDFQTGLGTITATVGGAGVYNVIVGLNHDFMPESEPTFLNEFAAPVGVAGGGLSWEIDEPGYVYGNLFANVATGLDNANALPGGGPEDVAWALGRAFTLVGGQTGTLTFSVSTVAPAGGFYLHQWEPGLDLYFSVSEVNITGGGVPEPGTLFLFGTAVASLLARRSRRVGR